jgi:hypothetical protein
VAKQRHNDYRFHPSGLSISSVQRAGLVSMYSRIPPRMAIDDTVLDAGRP